MKIPRTPPDYLSVFRGNQNPTELFLKAEGEATRKDRYLHWDDLRHRSAPDGIDHQQWWAGLKLRRTSNQQTIPLKDRHSQCFNFSLTPGMFERLHVIDLRCRGAVEGPSAALNSDIRDRYYISSLSEEAITSSLIEGAAVTRRVAKEMLITKRPPASKGERMILNNFLTMKSLSSLEEEDLTPGLLLKIHQKITQGTLDHPDWEGSLRNPEDNVIVEDEGTGEVLHVPPSAEQLPDRIAAMCDFANNRETDGFLHPVIRSILLHFWLAYEHPFNDGNGRTARALFYWSMLRHGFWMFEFVSISQQILAAPVKYYRSFLKTETDGNDLNYFLFQQLNTIRLAIDSLDGYLARKQDEILEVHRLLSFDSGFNHRQLALLKHALQHPNQIYTVASHQNSNGVVTQTARTDLTKLVELGLLRQVHRGRGFIYLPDPSLTQKIRSYSADT